MKPTSLTWRLIPLVLSLHLAVFGTLVWVASKDVQKISVEISAERSDELLSALKAALTAPMLEKDFVTLGEVSQELVKGQALRYVVVHDLARREMARAGLHSAATLPPVDNTAPDEFGILHVELPLDQGWVRLGLNVASLTELRSRFAKRTAPMALIATSLATLVMMGVVFRLGRRLRRLELTANALQSGNMDNRADESGSDEIARLGKAFNSMARELSQRFTALEWAEAKSKQSLMAKENEHNQLATLLGAIKVGILFTDTHDVVRYANSALHQVWLMPPDAALVGLPAHEALRGAGSMLSKPDHFSRLVLSTPGTHETSDTVELEMGDGRILTQMCHPVRDADRRLIGRLWVFEDVTQERRSAEQLIYLAQHDGLTGLYNRRQFESALERELSVAARQGSKVGLLFFDLDEFKHLNDHYGHRAGDVMLTRVANEIGGVMRRNEVLARLGGDEFAMLVPDLSSMDEAKGLADRIVRAVARIPLTFDGRALRITTSLGIAVYPDHASNLGELVVNADLAMYRAKESGKNGWKVFDSTAAVDNTARLDWNGRLQHALENNGFVLHYQPVYHIGGTLGHYEALVRMVDHDHPDHLIAPAHFVPAAEKTSHILALDRWVLQAAVQDLALNPGVPGIAVNVSARTLAEVSFPPYLLGMLEQYNVPPTRLLIEVTETAAVSDLQDARRFLEILRPRGCRVCLDDFGSGFSSFSYLKHLDADVLKIDGQFIRDLAKDRANQLVVQAIVAVAKGLGKSTIAEFVEDQASLDLLTQYGVNAVQGYHLGLPSPAHDAFVHRTLARFSPIA
jgi:diguanylate cyclase (GGDEF)-like protein